MNKHAYGVRVVLPIKRDDRIVLVEGNGHSSGVLQFPGGKNDYGESLIETVLREVAEETGLKMSLKQVQRHPVVVEQLPNRFAGNPRHRLWLIFHCEPISLRKYDNECLRRGGELRTALLSSEEILSGERPVDQVTRLATKRILNTCVRAEPRLRTLLRVSATASI